MQRPLFGTCRDGASEVDADHFGVEGYCTCPASGGCYTPDVRPELIQVLTAVEGLDFPDFPHKVPIGPFPEAVRTIPGDSHLPFRIGPLGPVLATRYTQIGGLRPKSKVIDAAKVAMWRQKRGIPGPTRLVLIQETKDEELESLFPATLWPGFFPALAMLGNTVLVSPGYSVYDDGTMCEWLQLLNLKRSIFFAYQANLHGLPCIPCIGWNKNRPMDLERLAEWLRRQGDKVTHLAVNAQTGGNELWAALVNGMAFLESATGRTYHWLVVGGTDPLRHVYGRLPKERVTHLSAAVPMNTLMHRLIGQKGTNDLEPNELLRQNIEREDWRRIVFAIMADQSVSGVTVR